jgi:5'-nucleotidase
MKKGKEVNILVTNDDGIDSPGIFALVHALKGLGKVVVAAPDRQQSAVGHALTVSKPLRAINFHRNGEMFGYAINGTPSDSVKLAVSTLLDKKPDLVVSGINHGQNTSINILYSGTVSAATEGMLIGIPSIAVSLASYSLSADCSVAADISVEIAKKVLKNGLPKGTLLNINIPALPKNKIKGMKITRQSDSLWNDHYEKRVDPFGRDYYWFSGEYKVVDKNIETDDAALLAGYVSITPIQFKFTNNDAITKLRYLEKKRK